MIRVVVCTCECMCVWVWQKKRLWKRKRRPSSRWELNVQSLIPLSPSKRSSFVISIDKYIIESRWSGEEKNWNINHFRVSVRCYDCVLKHGDIIINVINDRLCVCVNCAKMKWQEPRTIQTTFITIYCALGSMPNSVIRSKAATATSTTNHQYITKSTQFVVIQIVIVSILKLGILDERTAYTVYGLCVCV